MTHDDDVRVDPDPIVRTALQLLPVPAHGDRFWADLDRRLADRSLDDHDGPGVLAGVAGAARDPDDGPPLIELYDDRSLAVVPPALRRRSNAVVAVAAVAAAVLVVVAGTALVRERSGTGVDTTEQAGQELGEATTTTVAATTEPSTLLSSPGTSSDAEDASSDAVLAWVAALGEGDATAAWEAMGPTSKEHFGTKAAFEDEMSAMAEGYGSWSAVTPEHVIVTPVLRDGDALLVVVTLVGHIAPEGTPEDRADAFPVRITGDTTQPEPFAFAGEIEFVIPEPVPEGGTRPIVDGDELLVVVPEGAPAPILRLDDHEPVVCGEAPGTELTELEEASGQRCSFTPAGGIPAGRRVLTVAYTSPGGEEISGQSVLFEAA